MKASEAPAFLVEKRHLPPSKTRAPLKTLCKRVKRGAIRLRRYRHTGDEAAAEDRDGSEGQVISPASDLDRRPRRSPVSARGLQNPQAARPGQRMA